MRELTGTAAAEEMRVAVDEIAVLPDAALPAALMVVLGGLAPLLERYQTAELLRGALVDLLERAAAAGRHVAKEGS